MNRVVSALEKHGVSVLDSFEGNYEDLMFPENAYIEIATQDHDKWDYFVSRVNRCRGSLVEGYSSEDSYTLVLLGGNNEAIQSVATVLLECIDKQYFKVCPKTEAISVLVKPTHACNLDCKYCYDKPFRNQYGNMVMFEEVLDRFLAMLSQYSSFSNFLNSPIVNT